MRRALYVPNIGHHADAAHLVETAVAAEATGWDAFFLWDHLLSPLRRAVDPWVTLGAIAARTERILLGTMITPIARRRPWVLALQIAALAQLAPGRVVLGVGFGYEGDFARFGEPAGLTERSARFDEHLAALRRLLAAETVSVDGDHVRLEEVGLLTEPVAVPIWTSGVWPRRQPFVGEREADGVFPIKRGPDGTGWEPLTPADVVLCREEIASRLGRQPRDFAVWSFGLGGELDPDLAADYDRAGATWWCHDAATLDPEAVAALARRGPR
jgi:alkanesulfonate monooxygenase SsuD/methylene tetrahydromethanopterin reductase-like flavin-dependent oxidoreductase (luciferase family)